MKAADLLTFVKAVEDHRWHLEHQLPGLAAESARAVGKAWLEVRSDVSILELRGGVVALHQTVLLEGMKLLFEVQRMGDATEAEIAHLTAALDERTGILGDAVARAFFPDLAKAAPPIAAAEAPAPAPKTPSDPDEDIPF